MQPTLEIRYDVSVCECVQQPYIIISTIHKEY